MNYIVNQASLPPDLRSHGMRVWVGDSPMNPQLLEERGLRVVFVLMERDAFGEFVILFAAAPRKTVSAALVRQCRQCALSWLANWAHI